jgi:DNA polymerase beta
MQRKLPLIIRKPVTNTNLNPNSVDTIATTTVTETSVTATNSTDNETVTNTINNSKIRPRLPLIVPKNKPISSNSIETKETKENKETKDKEMPFLHPETAAAIATTMRDYNSISLLKSKTFDINNENCLLIDQFKLLLTQIEHQIRSSDKPEDRKKHGFRLTSIKKAIEIIEDYPSKIKSGYEAKQVNGIGKGIADRIDEILKTGSLKELTEKKFATDYTEKVRELCGVTGIGEVRARELINKYDLQGVDDLINRWKAGEIRVAKNELTHHMEVGLRWYHDIKQKIPRDEMDTYSEILLEKGKLLDKRLKIQVCGSYRRGKAFSGDIDVLMTHPDLVTAADVEACPIKYLLMLVDGLIHAGIIVDSLTDKGETKYMGVCKISKTSDSVKSVGRRIDIRFIPYESWGAGCLYFTGAMHFNKIFRGIALQRGYTVNEYGIYRLNSDGKKGQVVPSFSEEQIFAIVGIDYLTPEEREMS